MSRTNRVIGLTVPVAGALVATALLLIALGGMSVSALAAPISAPSSTLRYVTLTGLDTANDCTVSVLPCRTVQRALNVAQSGDEIHVATGTYTGTMVRDIPSPLTATVIISKPIAALRGGYSSDFSQHDPQTHLTVLSASGSPGAFVLFISGTTAIVDGFTLTGASGACVADCSQFQYFGGAVRLSGGAPTLSNNRIENNFGIGRGGGMYVAGQAVATILGNRFYSNTTDGNGGAIYVQSGSAVISGNQILSNVAAVEGGGIYIDSNAAATIDGNTIAFNHAISSTASQGGGVLAQSSQGGVTITQNDVYSNVTAWGGGSGIDLEGPGLVDGNLIHQNQNNNWGGALFLNNASLPVTATNNVVYDNIGGGIQAQGQSVALVNNTVSGNHNIGNTPESGILIDLNVPPTTPITVSIINNIVVNGESCGIFIHNVHNTPGVVSNHNDVWGNSPDYCDAATSAGNISADPLFANSSAGDYHLSAGSPAIDAGTNVDAPATDKDGTPRPQAGGVDIGAYEHVFPALFLPLVQR